MTKEPTARKTVTLPMSMWKAADDYRFKQRIGSEAEALRRIFFAGQKALGLLTDEDNIDASADR